MEAILGRQILNVGPYISSDLRNREIKVVQQGLDSIAGSSEGSYSAGIEKVESSQWHTRL
jgi:hypothetical protein